MEITSPLSKSEMDSLRAFVASKHEVAVLFRRLIQSHMDELRDIKQIRNIGQGIDQALAGQELCANWKAYDILEKILGDFTSPDRRKDPASSSSFR